MAHVGSAMESDFHLPMYVFMIFVASPSVIKSFALNREIFGLIHHFPTPYIIEFLYLLRDISLKGFVPICFDPEVYPSIRLRIYMNSQRVIPVFPFFVFNSLTIFEVMSVRIVFLIDVGVIVLSLLILL